MTEFQDALERCAYDSGGHGLVEAFLWAMGPSGDGQETPSSHPLEAALSGPRPTPKHEDDVQ